MKRKVYVTAHERKIDWIIGFCAFPIVNVLGWTIQQVIYSQESMWVATHDPLTIIFRVLIAVLPWLINGGVLVLAFIFRPQFGVGYIAFIAIACTVVVALSVLFVAACFVSIVSATVIGPLAIALFAILMLIGLYYVGRLAVSLFRRWQSSNEKTSHQAGGNKD